MKIFKVLWFDDEEENINILRNDLSKWIIDCTAGEYELHIEDYRTYDEKAVSLVSDPMYNLLITDFNLLDGKNGGELVRIAKDNAAYKDILIYSSDAKSLKKTLEGLDGVYYRAFDDMDSLREKIKNVMNESLYRDKYALIRSEKNIRLT